MASKDDDKDDKPEGEAAADGAEGAEGAAEAAGKKRFAGKKLVLFIVLPILLLLGIGAGLYFSGVLGGGGDDPAAAEGAATAGAEGAGAESGKAAIDPNKPPVFFSLPEMVVNLQAERSRPVFLKIVMALELENDADVPVLEKVLPRVVDNFQVYLRELRVEELRGSAGMYRLREELLIRVQQAVSPIKVKDVLFKEMLVQ